MNNQAFNPYPRWKQHENSRTAASLIVQSNSPSTPSNKPKLRIDDLFMKKKSLPSEKESNQNQRKNFFKHAPLSEANQSPRQRNFQLPIDYGMELERLKKVHVGSPKNSAIVHRFEKIQGGLSGCKSEKNLPSFLRSNSKSPQKLQPKILCKERFKVIKKLGQGRFGAVYLARQIETSFTVALKVMNKRKIIQDNLLGQLIREIKIQTFLDHPNIIKCYGFFSDKQNFYALLELGSDGQLYDIMSTGTTLSQESTSFIIGSLLDAMSLMHKHKILHRDIKPQNVVVIHGNVKLCDFGWAVNKKQELRSTFCGTPLYLSPQILKGQRYDEKVDLWAIGIMAYELHLGNSPFDINQQQDLQKIVTDEIQFPKKTTKQFRQFINHILNKNPKERLNCQNLMKLEFIRKYQTLPVIFIQNMEAYILTDKVITKEHMTHKNARPKYIKKYDLTSTESKKRIRTVASRKPLAPIMFVNAPRTKDLLSQLSNPVETSLTTPQSSQKIDRYWTATSQSFRQPQKKNKVGLLIKTMEPQTQHYDAVFNSVSKRAPCWAFLPMRKQQTSTQKTAIIEPVSKSQTKKKKQRQRPSKPKPFQFGQFLQKEEQKMSVEMRGRGQVDSRLQYSTSDLGKCTVQIFKKYNLDKDSYFKRMLAALQQ